MYHPFHVHGACALSRLLLSRDGVSTEPNLVWKAHSFWFAPERRSTSC